MKDLSAKYYAESARGSNIIIFYSNSPKRRY